ncbi:MAG: BT4734/BF3469 family protein [Bacteroidota bacterium]
MEKLDKILIPYYSGNIYDSRVKGYIKLSTFINSHANPKREIQILINKINVAANKGDKKKKNELKTHLFYFTPSVFIKVGKKRQYTNVESFTGLAQLDFDGLDHVTAINLKQYLFDTYQQIICAYLSPSGKGVKCLIATDQPKDIEEYRELYAGLIDEFDWIDGFDEAPKNAVLPLYLSLDRKILFRDDFDIWTKRGEVANIESYNNLHATAPVQPSIDGDVSVYKSKAYYEKITIDIFTNKMRSIVSEPGHMQMRSACLVLGSRVGAGYIDKNTAMQIAENEIRANAYLQKGIANYIRTSVWAITQGESRPKYYQ